MIDIDAITLDIEAIRARLAACHHTNPEHRTAASVFQAHSFADVRALLAEVGRLRHYETAYDPDAMLEAKDEIARLKGALELAHSDNGQLVSEVKRLWRVIDGPR